MKEVVIFVDQKMYELELRALLEGLDPQEFLCTFSQTVEGAGFLSAHIVVIAMTARNSYNFIAKIQALFSSQTVFIVIAPPDDIEDVKQYDPDTIISSANLQTLIDTILSAGNSNSSTMLA